MPVIPAAGGGKEGGVLGYPQIHSGFQVCLGCVEQTNEQTKIRTDGWECGRAKTLLSKIHLRENTDPSLSTPKLL